MKEMLDPHYFLYWLTISRRYGLKDRLNAKWGVVSYLVGKIWDMDAAGESIIVRSDANNNEVVAIAKPTEDTILVQKI